MTSRKITLGGSVAQRPGQGGHTWVFLQYLLGLRRLGWDVLLVDRIEPEMCFDIRGEKCSLEDSANLAYVRDVFALYGCEGVYALLYDRGTSVHGSTRERVMRHVRESEVLINVMGFVDDAAVLDASQRRVFLDIDPGFSQMWQDLGWARMFDGYDTHVTVGTNVGSAGCAIPTCGLKWIPTVQPVVLEHWPVTQPTERNTFSSVGAWRGPFAPVEYKGVTYGLRAHEFRKLVELPKRSSGDFEIALDIHAADEADQRSLVESGWRIIDPAAVACDPDTYRSYVQRSAAEFMVAKNMYVATASGWFSDRSACYLASGRPVVAQDTGFGPTLPYDRGLVRFTTLDEAVDAVESVRSNYDAHARAARSIAEEHFDSDRVLTRLLERIGL